MPPKVKREFPGDMSQVMTSLLETNESNMEARKASDDLLLKIISCHAMATGKGFDERQKTWAANTLTVYSGLWGAIQRGEV